MLEIRHLTKVYKSKGGAEVKALDDVSISFEETGLVFLLGKSGSGKSTLLNLAGGLDEPTSGEVIVMGKSSRDFSGSDFDSYRNTFIGFIFQEYNVLNEFNVEDNIALALELQGKTKERDKVRKILEEVELGEFAKRKPNTLSGGQKQRIAIARALVKDPQIIMADEPTGALDSATGKQVFDTLKKLSETRLVLVVSHDREFAEIYGDRIVELKDGKIISDVTKVRDKAQPITENVTRIGTDTITVKKGAVDKTTLAEIEKFLRESEGDVLISKGEKDISSFKRANRIDDEGAQERFSDTDTKSLDIKEYDGKQTKFIRSKLPARKAIKIGASGLKLKPFRLMFTILLSFISFVMFGLLSTMMLYDGQSVMISTFMDSDYEYITLVKEYETRITYTSGNHTNSYTRHTNTQFTPAEVTALGGSEGFGAYSTNISGFNNLGSSQGSSSKYYSPAIRNVTVLPESHPMQQKIIAGTYPTADDEVCVSSYLVDCAINGTFYTVDEDGVVSRTQKQINTANDLVGERLSISNRVLKVRGVFESGAIPQKYDELKNASSDSSNWQLEYEFSSLLSSGLYTLAFVTQPLADELAANGGGSYDYIQYFDYAQYSFFFQSEYDENNKYYQQSQVKVYDPDPTDVQAPIVRLDGGTGVLKDDELILSTDFFYYYIQDKYNHAFNEFNHDDWRAREPRWDDFYAQYGDDCGEIFDQAYQEWYQEFQTWDDARQAMWNELNMFSQACDMINGREFWDMESETYRYPTAAEKAEALKFVTDYINDYIDENGPFVSELYRDENWSGTGFPIGEYKIVGFFYNTGYDRGYYCSQNFYDAAGVYNNYTEKQETNYVKEADAIYGTLFVPLVKDSAHLSALFAKLEVVDPDTDILYSTENSLYSSVEFVNEIVGTLSTVFLIAGIVLALFAALMLFNFITMSISNKKREIGILRAVGARGTDVFKIFFAESGIIVGICTVLALIGSVAVTMILNSVLKADAGLAVTLFVFGPLSVILMVGVALFVAVVATFLPVYFSAKKKPVESIRAL